MTKQKKPVRPSSTLALIRTLKARHQCGWGIWVLVACLLFLSLLAGANLNSPKRLYVAGQVAENDVIADRDLLVEDSQATQARRKQVLSLQPPVYDLSMEPYTQFQARILDILRALNSSADPKNSPELQRLIEEITPPVASEVLPELSRREVQSYLLKKLMPRIREQLAEGLVWDIRAARVGHSGIILRNLDANTEALRPDVRTLPDAQSFLAELSAHLREVPELNPQSRRAINILLSATMPSSLTLNREATQKRGADVVASITPIYYQIQKGELVLRKGERASREQQIKMQSLYNSSADHMHWETAGGAFICSLLLSVGFFMAPSGRPGTPLRRKDMLLISVVLLLFGVGAKCIWFLGLRLDSPGLLSAFAIAYPVGGAVGLVAMVFAARRYCTMLLLLSFFCMLMFKEDIALFVYYFLSGMLATWLVTSAQNRQDVVWSLVPLSLGMLIIWSGMALLTQVEPLQAPVQMIAVLISALLSLIMLFAVSPVLELTFGYSTRFRLMELMSLEQPLMQEIMVTIPGTYHHSLVVANMVEAGAKAIGANSLLCKVAALYHDAGKLTYPDYFIENQFGSPNKHDKLSPSMSALVLLSHVKKGTELAERYNLGLEICDIIRQHHGTRLMRYFYQKALDLGEKPQESDFSYPGPRPQTKEAAILMLADSVEASSRTLTDPTPARIKNHIDAIIKSIFAEGQLDESELTFKDLHFLSENFLRILTGIFHQRITYPEAKKPAQDNIKKPDETREGKRREGAHATAGGAEDARAEKAVNVTISSRGDTGEKPIAL